MESEHAERGTGGAFGTQRSAKYSTTGSCPAMSSCHTCAAAPSSASRTTPKITRWASTSTSASAATDIPIGRKGAWVFHHRVHQYVRSPVAFLDDSIFSPPFAAQDADETRVRCAAANQ